MKRSEYNIGEYLYGIPNSEESAKYHPEDQRVFIHDGYINGDGYGIVIGWHDGEIRKSTGYGNFCWGAEVRKATEEEIESFIKSIHNTEKIKPY